MEDLAETEPHATSGVLPESIPVISEITNAEDSLPQIVEDLKYEDSPVDLEFQAAFENLKVETLKIDDVEIPVQDSQVEAGDIQGSTECDIDNDQKNKHQDDTTPVSDQVEQQGGDSGNRDILKQNEGEDLSSGSSEDSEEDSIESLSTIQEESDEHMMGLEARFDNQNSGFRGQAKTENVYKIDEQFREFIQEFISRVNLKRKLVINEDTLFNEEMFPMDIALTEYVPTNLVCPSLKELHLLIPEVLDCLKNFDCKALFRQVLGDQTIGFEKEELIRDHILFLLNSINAQNLESFTLENINHGMNYCPKDRMSVWEESLRDFLSEHSFKLKKINIRTVKLIGVHLQSNNDWAAPNNKMKGNTFPNLEELSIILWEKSMGKIVDQIDHEKSLEQKDPTLSETYWVHLLQSRAIYGHLRKLVWMSTDSLECNDTFGPVLKRNEKTLVIVHIIIGEIPMKSETTEFPNIPCMNGLGTMSSCSTYANMVNLKSLYLRKPNTILTELTLLPVQLEELSLDFIHLETEDLIECLGKLHQLKKLRLVNNTPRPSLLPLEAPYLPTVHYGINEKVLKVILNHRKLDYVCILGDLGFLEGCCDASPRSTPIPSSEGSQPKLSKFKKFQRFLKRVYCRSMLSKSEIEAENENYDLKQSSLLSPLQEIALVGNDGIIIDRMNKEEGVAIHLYQ